jgi:lipopolysaccharide transport system permease protein
VEQATAKPPQPVRTKVIEPRKGWKLPSLRRDIWDQRDLIYFLARRDIAIRYRQSVVGAFWTVLQAVLMAAVFTLFFGNLLDLPSIEGIPYSLFAVTGMLLWIFFTTALAQTSESTVMGSSVISKVHFPRIALPIAALMPATVDFLVGFVVIVAITLAYGVVPGPQIALFPVLVLLTMGLALGTGLWFSALNVRYRDIYILLPFITLVGLFVSPILYPFDEIVAQVPAELRSIYELNPMVGILEGYRWMLLDTPFPGWVVAVPFVVSAVLLVSGALFFKRVEPHFADVI